MRKRIISIMLVICMVLMYVPTTALAVTSGTTEDGWQYTISDAGEVTIKKYTGSNTDIVIPNKIDGKSVTAIGEFAFIDCTSLTSVTIPNSVTTIGGYAFLRCSNLASIDIPNSVTTIGDSAFFDCSSLASIDIPNSVTTIGAYAFKNTSWLNTKMSTNKLVVVNGILIAVDTATVEVSIPKGVTTIGAYAFEYCESLTSIIIPDSVTIIGNYAFNLCTSLASITIPDSVTTIGESAFKGCTSLKSIMIPDSITTISGEVFSDCINLIGVTIPDSVTAIGGNAFANCTRLTSITIPNGVTSIEWGTFKDCTRLTSITIPDSVNTIGDYAFNNCTSLISITIPDSVNTIGENAFKDCTSLESIFLSNNTDTKISGIRPFHGIEDRTTKVKYQVNTSNNVTITEIILGDGKNSVEIPATICGDPVVAIADNVFTSCQNLERVFIPDCMGDVTKAGISDKTTKVKYKVNTSNNVTITEIILGDGKNSVEIPATICGYLVIAVESNHQSKVGTHTHIGTCVAPTTCTICNGANDNSASFYHNLNYISETAATVTETGNKEYWYCDACSEYFSDKNGEYKIADIDAWKTGAGKIDKLPPEIIEGVGQSVIAGEKKELSFTSNAAYSDFNQVEVDSNIIDSNNYTVKEGSTIVTLKAEYVSTLSVGEHTISIVSQNGPATTKFTVRRVYIYNPPIDNTPTESFTSPVSDGNAIEIKAQISDGVATVSEITTETINKMLDNASSNGDTKVDTIKIDLSGAKQEVKAITLSKKTLETLATAIASEDNDIDTVTIVLIKASIVLDSKTLETVVKEAKGNDIKLVINDKAQSKLNTLQQNAIKKYHVATLFEAIFESNGKEIHDFNGGTATVTINFEPEEGKNMDYYHMVHISDDGVMTRYKTRYTAGKLSFITPHFSDYAVIYDESEKNQTAIERPVPVTGLDATVDKTTLTKKGATATIKVTVQPDDATNKNVTYTSSNTKVAKVDKNGKVTAVANGKTTVTVKTVDGSFTKKIVITVKIPDPMPTKAQIAANSVVLNSNATAKWTKENYLKLTWGKVTGAAGYEVYVRKCDGKSLWTKAAYTAKSGKTTRVTLKKLGGKKFSTTANYKYGVRTYKYVNGKKVYIGTSLTYHFVGSKNKKETNAKSVTAGRKAITLGVKKTTKLTSMISKVNKKCKLVKHDTLVRYISSNPSVAKVDLNTGKVTGVKAGKCKIYCIALNGVKTTVSVTVK